jgi:hypothetical protein
VIRLTDADVELVEDRDPQDLPQVDLLRLRMADVRGSDLVVLAVHEIFEDMAGGNEQAIAGQVEASAHNLGLAGLRFLEHRNDSCVRADRPPITRQCFVWHATV